MEAKLAELLEIFNFYHLTEDTEKIDMDQFCNYYSSNHKLEEVKLGTRNSRNSTVSFKAFA